VSRRVAALALLLATGLLVACTQQADEGEPAEAGVPTALPSLAVGEPVVWLCRPGSDDATCTEDLDAVVVTAAGRQPDPFEPPADPPVDCFYVYPTVSEAATVNAPKAPEPAVVATVRAQAALFGEVCRVFAPVYRQVSRYGLTSGRFFDAVAQRTAFDDVRDAWRSYLNEDNDGRGVVLVGHSQGAMVLARLLEDDVARQPAVRERVVSALLVGGQVSVPEGSDVADRAGHLPACRAPGQTGCVVAYSTFLDVPPPDALFGRASPGRSALCTDPTRLSGGDGTLHPYVPTERLAAGGGLSRALPVPAGTDASFVAYPGAATAECREQDGASWLQVTPVPGAELPAAGGQLPSGWGLHAVDVTLALGDLVEVVRRQAEAWPSG
jgi:hypothetical protein